jgi:hypothetical protein
MATLDTVPGWSGLFLERDEVAYLEVSDLDTRHHRPPEGWTLVTIDECPEHSSQIFRYVRTDLA